MNEWSIKPDPWLRYKEPKDNWNEDEVIDQQKLWTLMEDFRLYNLSWLMSGFSSFFAE